MTLYAGSLAGFSDGVSGSPAIIGDNSHGKAAETAGALALRGGGRTSAADARAAGRGVGGIAYGMSDEMDGVTAISAGVWSW